MGVLLFLDGAAVMCYYIHAVRFPLAEPHILCPPLFHWGGGFLASVGQLVVSVASAYRRHSARYTAADPLLFADVYGRIVKKKADTHGYISASTG